MANTPAAPLKLTDEQRAELEKLARSSTEPHRAVMQARALLMAGMGTANARVAEQLGASRSSVLMWRERFVAEGIDSIGKVRKGRGRKPSIPQDKVHQIVKDTLTTTPDGATHWSTRSMARTQGVGHSTVQRIWSARGIKPHLIKTFKLSNDPRFEEKLIDVVGLYLNPPDKAVVLCVDEKSQIQALNRTQPSLPMKPGRAGTMTHDYKRNGTTTLFAAINVLTGVVFGKCLPRHRHEEFLKFLRIIDKQVPRGLAVHLIIDNYSTHKHEDVQRWLTRHKRFHLHFTPTSSSWLNIVERWFSEITTKRIRRGSFESVAELIAAIEEYLEIHNADPRPFVWTATADSILEKVKRGRTALGQLSS